MFAANFLEVSSTGQSLRFLAQVVSLHLTVYFQSYPVGTEEQGYNGRH